METPEGTATLYHHGFIVINADGTLESFQGPTIIPGLSSGNVRDMLTALAAVGLEFAQKTELTTDKGSSPDDKQPALTEVATSRRP